MDNNSLINKLEIFLITFNRASKLEKTLKQLLDKVSPIKDFPITIIDNNSKDNTALVVQKYQSQYKNIQYVKNKYNIGGNANIVKAFYKATKEYVWILADNDSYSWDAWGQVEQEIEKQADAIVVTTYECPKLNIAQLFLQTTFLPGAIYKTSNIDDTVMLNMEFNIANMFPHLALSAKLINEKKNISIIDKPIVSVGNNENEAGEYTYTRGFSGYIHPLQKGMNWISGYANSLHLIKNPKIRNYIISHNSFGTELNSAKLFFYKDKAADKNLYNYLCVFAVLSSWNKLKFIMDFILYLTVYKIIFISRRKIFNNDSDKYLIQFDLRLFGFIKTKLFKISKRVKGEYR